MTKQRLKAIVKRTLSTVIIFFALTPTTALAALPGRESARQTADRAGLGTESDVTMLSIIGSIVNSLLVLMGIVLLILTIYAGFLWMTAGGNQDQITKAKGILRNAMIGLVITFSAYAIADFVFGRILIATVG